MAEVKRGALTVADLFNLWKAATDAAYRNPLIKAGDGKGLEVYSQMFEQFARVSKAIDVTTQAMYVGRFSGQTNPPASGGVRARVTLTLRRTLLLDRVLILGAGTFIEEQTTDYSKDGPVDVFTGRLYALTETVIFFPGDQGPYDVEAVAERTGYGYNNPLPNTIKSPVQIGARLANDAASVITDPDVIGNGSVIRIDTPNSPDTYVPESVGQYTILLNGANLGKAGRIVSWEGPDITAAPPIGSRVNVELLCAVDASVYAGTFLQGEEVTGTGVIGGVYGERLNAGVKQLVFRIEGTVSAGTVLTGQTSGATLTVQAVLQLDTYTPIAAGQSWRILSWAQDWGLTSEHPLSPQYGAAPWLDALGAERGVYRAPGEDDESYRNRIEQVADTVAPNAIIRILNTILQGLPFCLREVGTPELPGFFYDGDFEPPSTTPHSLGSAWAYDMYCVGVNTGATVGTFIDGEPAVIETIGGGVRYWEGDYAGSPGANQHYLAIREDGTDPFGGFVGTELKGLQSGATAPIVSRFATVGGDARRYDYYFSFAEFRGFFLVCLPRLQLSDFGFAYDDGAHNAFDAILNDNFWDGYPSGDAAIYSSVYNAVAAAKAAGVGFDLVLGCEVCT